MMNEETNMLSPGTPPAAQGPEEEEAGFFRRIHPAVFALLSLVLVFFLYQLLGGGIALIVTGGKITEENVNLVRWTTLIGQVLFILIPTIVLVRLRERRIGEFFRLHVPDYRQVIAAVIAVFALQQMLVGYMALQDLIPLPPELQKILDMVKKLYEETYRLLLVTRSPLEFTGVVIIVALVPAVSEELLFRGLVQRNFEMVAGGWRGALLAGIIFGGYHLIPTSFVPLSILGIFLGFLVFRTGNIVVAMSAHFFNNFVACAAVYMQLDEDFVVVSPSGGVTAASMVANFAVFAVVFLGATSYLLYITRPHEAE
jgi:hypothetical protein